MANSNNLFRKRFLRDIAKAIQDADEAIEIEHSGLAGRIREILLAKLLEPILPPEVKCGTGKLADRNGGLSKQIDVILYSRQVLPPVFYCENEGVFPIESCLYNIEVKSTVTSQSFKDAIVNAKSTQLKPLYTEHWNSGQGIQTGIANPICALFGFSSDLSGKGKSELDRYRELDDNANDDPAITVICVRGQGYWYYKNPVWVHHAPTSEFDEILDFLSGISNTIPQFISAKGRPRFGNYLILDTRNGEEV